MNQDKNTCCNGDCNQGRACPVRMGTHKSTEVLGSTCMDGGKCHHKDICTERCFRRECCEPLTLAQEAGLTMEQWRYQALTASQEARAAQAAAVAHAAEYDRWILFHAAGNGDYEDFLCKEHAGIAPTVQPSKAKVLAHYSQMLAMAQAGQREQQAVQRDALEPQVPESLSLARPAKEPQLHAGRDARKNVGSIWHTDCDGLFWCGDWYHRTPAQLERECISVIKDLRAIAAAQPPTVQRLAADDTEGGAL